MSEPTVSPDARPLAGRSGWFVTGTGWGVGKTTVAAALCRLRADLGREVIYVKPVQPGGADGEDDAADVAALAGVPTVTGPVVGPPMPPGVAARLAGAELHGDELVAAVIDAAAAHPDAELVVEGAGGLLEVLGSDGTTCADLAAHLGLPLLVVTRPGWRELHHVALTLEVVSRRGLTLAGVVVSGRSVASDQAPIEELQRRCGQLTGALPALDLAAAGRALDDVADHLGPELGGRWALGPGAGPR